MDREKYGKIIVDQIINDYKNSEEFRSDAAKFMYRWFMCILNHKTVSLGDHFIQTMGGKLEIQGSAKSEFVEGMTKYNDYKAKLEELYNMLDDDYNKTLYPNISTDNKNNKICSKFLID